MEEGIKFDIFGKKTLSSDRFQEIVSLDKGETENQKGTWQLKHLPSPTCPPDSFIKRSVDAIALMEENF